MNKAQLTEMELDVLKYWTNKLDQHSYSYPLIKSVYREIRLYREKREYVNGRFQMVSNIKKEYEPVINSLLENKILTVFVGRGGKFYQLSKKGFELFYGTGKESN